MKRKYMIPLLLVIVILLGACSPGLVDTIPMESTDDLAGETGSTESTVPPDTTPEETTTPVDENVEKFQKLLHNGSTFDKGNWYLQALNCEYQTTDDIDLASLFYNGFTDERSDPTEAEIEYLNSTGRFPTEWQCMDFFRLPVDKMDAVLKQYFGTTFEQVNKESLDQFVYWEETNCYYASHTDARGHVPVVTEVVEWYRGMNRRISVFYYDQMSFEKFVLTVGRKDGGGYYIVSNLAVLDGDKAETMKKTLNDLFNVFNQRFYSYVLGAKFVSPEWVDLGELFSNGIPGNGEKLTDHEKEVLVKMGFNLNLDTVRLSADDMDAVLKEYLGIGLDQVEVNGFRNLVYMESTECWYRTEVPSFTEKFEATDIMTDGKGFYVVSYVANLRKGVMEIREKENGGYYILSNRYEYWNPES